MALLILARCSSAKQGCTYMDVPPFDLALAEKPLSTKCMHVEGLCRRRLNPKVLAAVRSKRSTMKTCAWYKSRLRAAS